MLATRCSSLHALAMAEQLSVPDHRHLSSPSVWQAECRALRRGDLPPAEDGWLTPDSLIASDAVYQRHVPFRQARKGGQVCSR